MLDQDKKNILLSAISEINGTIKLIDTKVSIMLAAAGIFFSALIACRSNVLKAYYYYSNSGCSKIAFVLFSVLFILLILAFASFALLTILPRSGKNKSSIWFFDAKNITIEKYFKRVDNATEKELMRTLKSELYSLNQIAHTKILLSKIALILFWASIFTFIMIIIMVGYYYAFI